MIKKTDVELALISAFGMAIPIFFINFTQDWQSAFLATLVQFCYTSFSVALGSLLCRKLAKKKKLLAILLPSILTLILTFLIHTIAKSPQPLWSALYSFIIALPSYTIHTYRFRISELPFIEILLILFKKSK